MKYAMQAFVISLSAAVTVIFLLVIVFIVSLQWKSPDEMGKGPAGDGGPFICTGSQDSPYPNIRKECQVSGVLKDLLVYSGLGIMAFYFTVLTPITLFNLFFNDAPYLIMIPLLFYGWVTALTIIFYRTRSESKPKIYWYSWLSSIAVVIVPAVILSLSAHWFV